MKRRKRSVKKGLLQFDYPESVGYFKKSDSYSQSGDSICWDLITPSMEWEATIDHIIKENKYQLVIQKWKDGDVQDILSEIFDSEEDCFKYFCTWYETFEEKNKIKLQLS